MRPSIALNLKRNAVREVAGRFRATKVTETCSEFTQLQSEVAWRSMRGMRNRIAHGYFEINLDVVWNTVQTALPELLKQLSTVRALMGAMKIEMSVAIGQ